MPQFQVVSVVDLAPDRVPRGQSKAAYYRWLISAAIRADKDPLPGDGACGTTSIHLFPAMLADVDRVATAHKIKVSDAASGLLRAGLELAGAALATADSTDDAAFHLRTSRPEQATYYARISRTLRTHPRNITLAEGSTGIGKGRAIMAAGYEAVLRGRTPVVVCTSSIALAFGLLAEFEGLAITKPVTYPAFAPAWREFLDVDLLESSLPAYESEFPADVASLRKWLADDGRWPHKSGRAGPLSNNMLRHGHEPKWLVEAARSVVDEIPVAQFAIRSAPAPDNPELGRGHAEALAWRAYIRDKKFIVCTHAMVAVSQKSSWQKGLPQPTTILVDEAHLLEQSYAGVHSRGFSVHGMRTALTAEAAQLPDAPRADRGRPRKKPTPRQAVAQAVAACERVIAIAQTWCEGCAPDASSIPIDEGSSDLFDEIIPHLQTLARLTEPPPKGVVTLTPHTGWYRDELLGFLRDYRDPGASHVLSMQVSSTRRYPTFVAGSRSVKGYLINLWRTCSGGAILASATMSTPDADNVADTSYMRNLLGVPMERCRKVDPVFAQWIFGSEDRSPTFFYPSRKSAVPLMRPRRGKQMTPRERKAFTQRHDAWMTAVANKVFRIAATAGGGVMCLCTSYKHVSDISDVLLAKGFPKSRLVVCTRGTPFHVVADAFRAIHASGRKPLLLAVGVAGTGVGFVDETDPAHDTLLTDLIISCLPIALNRTATMSERQRWHGQKPMYQESVLQLRQWCGRLVRRPGLLHRRLWLLDGRYSCIDDHSPEMADYIGMVRRAIAPYRNKVPF